MQESNRYRPRLKDSRPLRSSFSRSKVERCNFSHFLGLHAPDTLPTGRRLRDMMSHQTRWLQVG